MFSFSAETSSAPRAQHVESPRDLPGDIAVWFFIFAELLAFGIFFVAYGFARARNPAGFAARQALLPLTSGAINTALLLASSIVLAEGVWAEKAGERIRCLRALAVTATLGVAFLLHKLFEFRHMGTLGWFESAETFDLLWLLMTGFHFLHVALGVVVLIWMRLRLKRGCYATGNHDDLDGAAAYWHMVDMVWLILFPLLYVLR